jgi:hypothetical protein
MARTFHALGRRECIYAACALLGAWAYRSEGLLVILAFVASYRAFATEGAAVSNRRTLYEYVGLVIALAWLMRIHVPV